MKVINILFPAAGVNFGTLGSNITSKLVANWPKLYRKRKLIAMHGFLCYNSGAVKEIVLNANEKAQNSRVDRSSR